MKNIRLGELLSKDTDEIDRVFFFFKHAKPVSWCGKIKPKQPSIMDLSYKEVAHIRMSAEKNNYQDIFSIVYNLSDKGILRLRIKEFFPSLNWIKKELDGIANAEKRLTGDIDPKLEQAGVKELERFGHLNALFTISRMFQNCPPFEVEKWPYKRVFSYLYKIHVDNEIEKNYQKIIYGN